MLQTFSQFKKYLFEESDGASLVLVRIWFGAIVCFEACQYIYRDWVKGLYVSPPFHFKYLFFEWVEVPRGNGMYFVFALLCAAGILIALGLFYRFAALLSFLCLAYIFLAEQALYLNHAYLIVLFNLLLVFIPANRQCSVDALLWPKNQSPTVPNWAIALIQFQVAIPYFFSGIAKFNYDWLVGVPLDHWLAVRAQASVIGEVLSQPWLPMLLAWSGLLLDMLAIPLLLWRKTRFAAFLAIVGFHAVNGYLFQIGVFPYFMLGVTTIFFEPDWPRRALSNLRRIKYQPLKIKSVRSASNSSVAQFGFALASIYIVFQLLFPLRHWLYPGSVHWTEEGHRYSWHMKLRQKSSKVTFVTVSRLTGQNQNIDPRKYLNARQYKAMKSRPDMILQFAHYLRDEARARNDDVAVHALAIASLNGREPQLLIDPKVDLAQTQKSLRHASWIFQLGDPKARLPNPVKRSGPKQS